MTGRVVCDCCGNPVPVEPGDLGRSVVCPTSGWLVAVPADAFGPAADAPAESPAADRGVPGLGWAVAAGALLVVVLTGLHARDWRAGSESAPTPATAEVAAVTPAPEAAPPTPAVAAGAVVAPIVAPSAPATVAARPASEPAAAGVPPAVEVAPAPRAVAVAAVPAPAPTPAPSVVVAPPAPPAPPVTPAPPADGGLAKRIDRRTAAELQRELLAVREVRLDSAAAPQTSKHLHELAVAATQTAGGVYPGPAVAARGRHDLAALPFKLGPDAVLLKHQAEAMDALSKRLRDEVQRCIPADRSDPRPDPDRLQSALVGERGGRARDGRWATAEAVPCIQQMLQAEGPAVRRMSVDLLRGLDVPAATTALVQWAVFDLDPANRRAAVDALRSRDPAAVGRQLLDHLRYPWPRAAEHAAEALVALDRRDAVPALAAALARPDPDAPRAAELPSKGAATAFRRELVRVNHVRNCVLCHRPSAAATDLVRAAVPDPNRPLGAALTPEYYGGPAAQFVSAATTYLRQDFSAVQPVADHGPWPDQQRFDYLVAVRPARPDEAAASDPAYRGAVLFALRELTGEDRGPDAEGWAPLAAKADPAADRLAADAGRFLLLNANPMALTEFHLAEFGPAYLTLSPRERKVVLAKMRQKYGPPAVRAAEITYLEGVARAAADPDTRRRADDLLVALRGPADPADGTVDPADAVKLLGHKNPQVRAAAAAGLEVVGKSARGQAKELVDALADADAGVRKAAADALGATGGAADEAYDALAKAMRDKDAAVRTAAVAALGKLGELPKSAAKPLAEGLVHKAEWAAAADRAAFEKAALELLTGMKGRAAGGYGVLLAAAVGDTPTDVPAATLKALDAAGGPTGDQVKEVGRLLGRDGYAATAAAHLAKAGDAAVPVLVGLLKDARPAVRATAAEALGKAASLGRNPPPAPATWRAALDALGLLASDPAREVRDAARAARTKLNARD